MKHFEAESSKIVTRMEGDKQGRKKIKTSDEMGIDRLSNLPDSVIHHILSLMDAKYAVQTSILSKKWMFHWAHVPSYGFNPSNSSTDEFQDFVAHVLNNRQRFNRSRPRFVVSNITMPSLVKMFYRYVLTCSVEELDVREKVQINDQMVVDRLSSLPDSIIHHILSFMDTKYAVQTCVLSKNWRHHWTNIHSLNFDHSSFRTWVGFEKFVRNVLSHRKPIGLRKLKIICGSTVTVTLMRLVFGYAQGRGLEELETDAFGYFFRTFVNNRGNLDDFLVFETLRTLQISSATFRHSFFDLWGARDLYQVDNLHLVNCALPSSSRKVFRLNVPSVVTLTISDLRFCEMIWIKSKFLRIFNWKGESPCLLEFTEGRNNHTPEEVNIHMSPPVDCGTKKWFAAMREMVEGCCGASSITVLLNISKETFILYYRRYSCAEVETRVVELNKETREEKLLVRGFELNQLATILEEIFAEKKEKINNQIEIDRLSNLPDHLISYILSFLDTKSAVRTCVLSKTWWYHWTDIHNLNLECRSNKITNFKNFVLHVLHHRKPLNLSRLRFHIRGAKSKSLMRKMSSYALSSSLEELDTNLSTFPPTLYQCQTLRTLKLVSCSSDLPDLSGLTSLMTLELTDVWLPDSDFFSRCLILENLSITECQVMSLTSFNISAAQLVKLVVSNFRFLRKVRHGKIVRTAPNDGQIVINAPRMKFFNLKQVDPLVLSMDDCPNLEIVNIHMSLQKVGDKKQAFNRDMFRMVEGLFHVKSLRISLNFTKEKFILCRNDEETKIAVQNKETGVEQLIGLATMLEES